MRHKNGLKTSLPIFFHFFFFHLATAKSIFARKERFNETSALKNHSKVNAPVEFINTRHNLFTGDFAL